MVLNKWNNNNTNTTNTSNQLLNILIMVSWKLRFTWLHSGAEYDSLGFRLKLLSSIVEYAFMCCPINDYDLIWNLHLIYTRNYLHELIRVHLHVYENA